MQMHNYAIMRVTIDVDEKLWKEIMKYITEKFGTPYGKYRKIVINELLRKSLEEIKREESNLKKFKKLLLSSKLSPDFLSFMEETSKKIRVKARMRKWTSV